MACLTLHPQLGWKPSTRNRRCTLTKSIPTAASPTTQRPFAKINTIPVTAESVLIAEAKQMRLDNFHSDKICTSAASISEYAHIVLGHPFKVSRCRTTQALKLSARVKCTCYNTAEAQRQPLLDLFGYVEPSDPVALADPTVQKRLPAIDSEVAGQAGMVGNEVHTDYFMLDAGEDMLQWL